MRTAYIATKLDNHARHNQVRDALNAAGFGCSYDWTTHGSVKNTGHQRIAEVAKAELEGVRSADVVIVLLPGGRGTHAELGMAIALGKPVILMSENQDCFHPTEATCAFYHAPGVHWARTVDEAVHYSLMLLKELSQ